MTPEFWELTISGAIVTWPVFIAGQWLSHRKLKAHIDKVTAGQTGTIAALTDDQTHQLLAHLPWWRRLWPY